jgi:hypothetical protein
MIQSKPSIRLSYLLHCWEERKMMTRVGLWRFSLEDPVTGQRRDFANLREVVIALNNELIGLQYEQTKR